MTQCPKCGYQNNDAKFCTVCGCELPAEMQNQNDNNMNNQDPTNTATSQQDFDFVRPDTQTSNDANIPNNIQNDQAGNDGSNTIDFNKPIPKHQSQPVTQPNNQPVNNEFNQPNTQQPQQQYNPNNQQFNMNQQPNGQPFNQYNQYNQYNTFEQNVPRGHKSAVIAFILGFIISGAGYMYLGQWGKGLVVFFVCWFLNFIGMALIFPLFISLIIWIYSLYDVNRKVEMYNRGQPID
ncbi:MAG: hypothetical protein BZ136_08045 [Methanosphaera sp. rholeuAM74]|nr:MAG: hypothetical protein BZ136_08045 [Methanosphaera sp. rholeuAM74]